jgi:hypothetical protein
MKHGTSVISECPHAICVLKFYQQKITSCSGNSYSINMTQTKSEPYKQHVNLHSSTTQFFCNSSQHIKYTQLFTQVEVVSKTPLNIVSASQTDNELQYNQVYCNIFSDIRSQGSSVSIETRWRDGWLRLNFQLGQLWDFSHFTITSRMVMGPAQPPIQWVPKALTPGVKLPGHHSPPSSVEVKNAWT